MASGRIRRAPIPSIPESEDGFEPITVKLGLEDVDNVREIKEGFNNGVKYHQQVSRILFMSRMMSCLVPATLLTVLLNVTLVVLHENRCPYCLPRQRYIDRFQRALNSILKRSVSKCC